MTIVQEKVEFYRVRDIAILYKLLYHIKGRVCLGKVILIGEDFCDLLYRVYPCIQ